MYSMKYEEEKERLIELLLSNYSQYKEELNSVFEQIKADKKMYVDSGRDITKNKSAVRSYIDNVNGKDRTKDEEFMIQCKNISDRFKYIQTYQNKYNGVKTRYNNLIKSVKKLSSFISITNDGLGYSKKGDKILKPIYTNKFTIDVEFHSMNLLKSNIDTYIKHEFLDNNNGFAYVEENNKYIDNNNLKQREREFFETLIHVMEFQLEQVKNIEQNIDIEDVQSYLKYYLFYK